MGWCSRELLYVVYSDGAVEAWDLHGERSDKSFSLLSALSEEEIMHVVLQGDAMAALSHSSDGVYAIYLVYSLENPAPVAAADTGLSPTTRPKAMAILPSQFTSHGRAEVILATRDKSLVVIDSDRHAADMQLDDLLPSPVLMMSVSPGGKYIACLGEDAVLSVLETTFDRKLLEFDTKATEPPAQLCWCGEDSVVLTFADRGLQLVGPFGDWLRIPIDTAFTVAQEVDGVRVIAQTHHEIVQRVPASLVNIRSIGSTAASAVLADASHAYSEGDARCDDTVRSLLSDGDDRMREAILECIQAATHEWDTSQQRALLKAASYGKSFVPSFDRDVFVDACRTVRALNHLRASDVGVPLTVAQYDALTPAVIVDRLMARHRHKLALDLCDHVGLSRDKVLVHWACAKVRASSKLSDEAVRDLVREKLASVSSVSYADIAATADSAGRRRLATMLLDFEPRAADRVPILLKMREGRLALEKALQSGDTDLCYLALLHLRRTMRSGGSAGSASTAASTRGKGAASAKDGSDDEDGGSGGSGSSQAVAILGPFDPEDDDAPFLKVVLAYPSAIDLLAAWSASQDRALLLKLYLACGRYVDAGRVRVQDSYREPTVTARVAQMRKAVEIFREGEKNQKISSSARSEAGWFARSCDEQVSLLVAQANLQDETAAAGVAVELLDLSLADTLYNLLLLGGSWIKKADKMAKEFKLSEAAYAFVKVRALAHARDWQGLWTLANERKSPIGYKPFADACLVEGAAIEAKRYVKEKITDYSEKIDLLIKLGLISDAAEAAAKAKDGDRLEELMSLAKTPAAQEAVEKAMASLQRG